MKDCTIERMLGLPQRFLSKKENLELPETQVLLKLIDVFPWLLKVADSGYDPIITKRIMAEAIGDEMLKNKCNELIKKYPHLYADPNPESKEPRYYMQIGGFETYDGWYDLLDKLSQKISDYLKENSIEGFYVHQVKSKFADLCYYPNTWKSPAPILDMIREAEKEALNTCEFCGTQEGVKKRSGGWIVNSCTPCVDRLAEEAKERNRKRNEGK